MLSDVYMAKYRAVMIIGSEQGGLISLLCARSQVLEVACRARILTAKEMRNAREAWCGVVSTIAINPVVLPQRSVMQEIQAAIPEVGFAQSKGQHRMLLINKGLVALRTGTKLSRMTSL